MTIEQIESEVLKHFPNISSVDLKTTSKEQRFVQPRLMIWYIARYTYSVKVVDLSKYYNRRHSTVCRMLFNTNECLEFNKPFKNTVDKIIDNLLETATC